MGKIFDKVLRIMGFKELIKIPGKTSYDQLTNPEVAMMIDAFLTEGNEFFDPLAFNDFLHTQLKNSDLKQLQEDMSSKAFGPTEGNEWPPINRHYLEQLIHELRREE